MYSYSTLHHCHSVSKPLAVFSLVLSTQILLSLLRRVKYSPRHLIASLQLKSMSFRAKDNWLLITGLSEGSTLMVFHLPPEAFPRLRLLLISTQMVFFTLALKTRLREKN